jgi:hypothetical protein
MTATDMTGLNTSPVMLDFTSDSCAVLVTCDEFAREELGGSIGGSSIETDDDGFCYAMVGAAWDGELSDSDNEDELDRAADVVKNELSAARLWWTEEA